MATEITAKGDLIVGTGSGTFDNLPVAENGSTIVADSSATTGLRYQGNFAAGKNAIINGDFNIWQRGTSFTSAGASADRWQHNALSPDTITQQTFTPGAAPVAGYEGQFFFRFTGTASTIDARLFQPIEDVRTFAGQTVTLSFWAKSDVSTALNSITLRQNFGSGGSANVDTTVAAAGTVTLTSSWVRYTYTFTVPSVSGKTIGASSYLRLQMFGLAATAYNLDVWGVQLEAGSVATAFQTATGTIQGELDACARYLPVITVQEATGYAYGTDGGIYTIPFLTEARVAPTGMTIISGTALAYALNVGSTVTPAFNAASVSMANIAVTSGLTITAGQGSRIGNGFKIAFTGCEL
jgi:hypothetical protein